MTIISLLNLIYTDQIYKMLRSEQSDALEENTNETIVKWINFNKLTFNHQILFVITNSYKQIPRAHVTLPIL